MSNSSSPPSPLNQENYGRLDTKRRSPQARMRDWAEVLGFEFGVRFTVVSPGLVVFGSLILIEKHGVCHRNLLKLLFRVLLFAFVRMPFL